MDVTDVIRHLMETGELPYYDRLRPDYEYHTIEFETASKEVFVLTVTKRTPMSKIVRLHSGKDPRVPTTEVA